MMEIAKFRNLRVKRFFLEPVWYPIAGEWPPLSSSKPIYSVKVVELNYIYTKVRVSVFYAC